MTIDGPGCPSDMALNDLITGKLDENLVEEVLRHLESCAACHDRLDGSLASDDSFSGDEIAAAGDHVTPASPAFRKATDQLRELRQTATDQTTLDSLTSDPSARYSKATIHATGGAGQVWRAADKALDREVALKELRPDQRRGKTTVARFLNEAKVTGQLSHPGIVPVYDVGFENGKPFYTMKLVQGKTLNEAAADFATQRSQGNADAKILRRLVNAVISVANTVGYAHAQGVLHRDLKGKNVVLGDFGEVMVLDWGLARRIDSTDVDRPSDETLPITGSTSTTQTEDGSVIGTPAFMAPEQAMGKRSEMNERTDVYGLGAVLYQVLTGEAPFGSGDSSKILNRVLNDTPPAPATHWAEVPRGLEAICMKALSREQQSRYETATAFAADLDCWLADEPVSAHPEPVLARMARWARHHQSWVAAASALAFTTLIALGTATILISREQSRTIDAQARAEANFERANETVSSLLSRIGDPRLGEVAELDELRAAMLEEAINFNQEFLRESSVPEVRFEAAKAHSRIAALQTQLGKINEAIASSEKSVGLLRRLKKQDDRLPLLDFTLASELGNLSTYFASLGKTDQSAEVSDEAIQLLRQSPEREANVDEFQNSLAELLASKANRLSERGTNVEAESTFKLALAALDQVSDKNARTTQVLCTRAGIKRSFSQHVRSTNRTEEAVSNAKEAVAILEQAARLTPNNQTVLFQLNETLSSLGQLLRVTGKRSEAREQIARAVEVNERLVDQFPYAVLYRKSLIDGYTGLGISFAEAGEKERAESIFRKGLAAAESLNKRYPQTIGFRYLAIQSRRSLAIALMNNNRSEEALPLLDQATKECLDLATDVPDVLDYQYMAAVSLGNLATTQSRVTKTKGIHFATIKQAAGILESLLDTQPHDISYRHKLGIVYRESARFYQTEAESDQAREYFEKAIRVHREIVALEADRPRHTRQLGIALFMLGRYCSELQLLDEAEPYMREAKDIRESVLSAEPNWFDAKMDFVLSHIDLGGLLIKQANFAEAEAVLQEGGRICKEVIDAGLDGEGPKREYTEVKRLIALIRLKQNRFEDALSALQEPMSILQAIRKSRPKQNDFTRRLRSCIANQSEAYLGLNDISTAIAKVDEMLAVEPLDDWGGHLDAARLLHEADSQAPSDELKSRAISELRLAIEKGMTKFDLEHEENEFAAVRELVETESLFDD
ncbi:MAG: protein kinase [Planctomycetaceae bacterium]